MLTLVCGPLCSILASLLDLHFLCTVNIIWILVSILFYSFVHSKDELWASALSGGCLGERGEYLQFCSMQSVQCRVRWLCSLALCSAFFVPLSQFICFLRNSESTGPNPSVWRSMVVHTEGMPRCCVGEAVPLVHCFNEQVGYL